MSPAAGTLTPARRETVLQQSMVYLHLFYINTLRSQQLGWAEGVPVSQCSEQLLEAISLQQKVFGCCSTVVELAPVFLCCDLGERVSRDVFKLCCSSCFPWSSLFVCVCLCLGEGGRDASENMRFS